VSDDAQEWRWVGEDGVAKTVTEQELIAELSSESLPNYTLVWKKRWLEWLPAMQVAELAWALPAGKADNPIKPREKDTAVTPPAPPLYRYPVIKRRAANMKTEKPSEPRAAAAPRPDLKKVPESGPKAAPTPLLATTPKAPPKAPPAAAAQPSPPPPVVAPEPPSEEHTEPRRQPAPEPPTQEWKPLDSSPVEEVDMDSIESSDPMAAALSGFASRSRDEDDVTLVADEPESDPLNPAEFGPVASSRNAFTPLSYGDEDEAETRVLPSRPPPAGPLYVAPHPPPLSERPPPSFDEDLEEVPRFPAPPPPPADLHAYADAAGQGARRARLKVWAIGGGAALVALVLLVLVTRRQSNESDAPAIAEPSSAAVATGSAPREPSTGAAVRMAKAPARESRTGKPCTVVTSAVRIADWAEPSVVPAFAAIPGSRRVAVGFAQTGTYAVGITIDPRTLDRDQIFREARQQKLVSVVPTADQGKLHFQVVREGFVLASARAVDATTPFFLGTTSEALARVVGKELPTPIWSFPEADQSTVPRIATVPGLGHAVALRRGGKGGDIAAGWLEPSGAKKSEMLGIRADGNFAGTPAIAASEDAILIAFASRKTDGPSWNIVLATAKHGQLPATASRFTLPPGGPGGDAMSPAIGALTAGRWLLAWTEGPSGNRVARAEVLDRDLTPLSDPLNLSPDGANAGQGVVWTSSDVGAVLFYVQNDRKSHELWGTSVECTR